jgi:Na+-translocating ferredoxin:NAD+ oxidoreductase RnfG subunit
MDFTTVLTTLITAISSVIVALITAGYFKRWQDRNKENKSKIVLSVVKKKKNQKGNIKLEGNKTLYKKKISSDYVEAGYMMINKSNLLKKKLLNRIILKLINMT